MLLSAKDLRRRMHANYYENSNALEVWQNRHSKMRFIRVCAKFMCIKLSFKFKGFGECNESIKKFQTHKRKFHQAQAAKISTTKPFETHLLVVYKEGLGELTLSPYSPLRSTLSVETP